LALTSPTSGGRSVGIVRSCTQAKEFVLSFHILLSPELECVNVRWRSQESTIRLL
jgi:hypothetical protein